MIRNLLVVLFVLPFASASGKVTQQKDGIYYLQKDDFDSIIGDKNFAVFFHSPWSDASSKVLFEYEKTANILTEEGIDMSYAVLDLAKDDYTGHRFGVNSGPALKLFHNTKPYEYEGNFTYVSIAETVRAHAQPDWSPPVAQSLVIELNSVEEFEAHIKKQKLTLVDFYAPWCNHCQQLEPVLNSVAEKLNKLDTPVTVAKINAEAHSELFARFAMKGYPYVILFKNGVHTVFEGTKNVPLMVDFVKARQTITSFDVPTKSGAAVAFGNSKKSVVVVGFFQSRSAYEFTMFMDVAESFTEDKSIKFGHVIGPNALSVAKQDFGIDSEDYGVAVVRDRRLPVKKGTQRFSVFAEDPMEKDSLKSFIKNNRRSIVGYAPDTPTFRTIYGGMSPLVLVFMDVEWDPDTWDAMNYRLKIITEVAEKYPDVHFVAMDHAEMHELKDFVGLQENDHDMAAALYVNHSVRYPLDGECNAKSLTAHVKAFQAGNKLQEHYRSQKVPTNNAGPVKTLVRATYNDVMDDTTHDVVVLFTASWSDESKKFLPVFKKAQKVLAADSVQFYKYDTTLNDAAKNVKIDTYPTLFLFKAGEERTSAAKKYEGPRNSNAIAEFLRDHAATLSTSEGEEETESEAAAGSTERSEL